MRNYKILTSMLSGKFVGVEYEENGVLYGVPADPDNTDYQAYLKWLAEGNEPLPAENA